MYGDFNESTNQPLYKPMSTTESHLVAKAQMKFFEGDRTKRQVKAIIYIYFVYDIYVHIYIYYMNI